MKSLIKKQFSSEKRNQGWGFRIVFSILLIFIVGLICLPDQARAEASYAKEFKMRCIHCHVDNGYPGGSFFEAENSYKWIFFYVATGIAAIFFLTGLVSWFLIWRKGKKSHVAEEYRSRPVPRFLTGILQLDLSRISKLRWVNYLLLSGSFLLLILFMLFVYGLALGLGTRTFTLPAPAGRLIDLGLDLLGLAILGGTILGFLRRLPPLANKYVSAAVEDLTSLAFIFVLVVTGFILESFRIAALPSHPDQYFSFVGFGLAWILRHAPLPWAVWHFYFWNIHMLLALAFIAYIPRSGFFHILTCPVMQTTSRKKEERIRLESYGKGRVGSGD
jgi:nitrate reductase gamma subunit